MEFNILGFNILSKPLNVYIIKYNYKHTISGCFIEELISVVNTRFH